MLLDGFVVQQDESISVIYPEDVLTIKYKATKEKKERKHKKNEEKVNKSILNDSQNEAIIDEKQNENTCDDGYCYPENRITTFDASLKDEVNNTPPLRILPKEVYSGGNTNTPTVNIRSTIKKTRRGKRGGQKQKDQSFLDFIVNEEPSVIMDSSIKDTSIIEQLPANDSLCINDDDHHEYPRIGETVTFPYVVMNYEKGCPESREVNGVVKKCHLRVDMMISIADQTVVVYSSELDEIVKVSVFYYCHVISFQWKSIHISKNDMLFYKHVYSIL